MRTLELRLEHVGYGWDGSGDNARPVKYLLSGATAGLLDSEQARLFAALEFFDRALVHPGPLGYATDIFDRTAALTLLRFGVRIVGLEAEP